MKNVVICPGCGYTMTASRWRAKNLVECPKCMYYVNFDHFPTIYTMMKINNNAWRDVDLAAFTRAVLRTAGMRYKSLPETSILAICPGCGNLVEKIHRCPLCGYEVNVSPYRFLSIRELASRRRPQGWNDVNLGAYLRAMFKLLGINVEAMAQ